MTWALPIFQHSGTGYIEIVVVVLILFDFSQKFSERALPNLKIKRDFNHDKYQLSLTKPRNALHHGRRAS